MADHLTPRVITHVRSARRAGCSPPIQPQTPPGRFGGVEFLPASILVRSHGEQGSHVSAPHENEARYNDFIPLVYGTAWYNPPIVFARNDGNLTRTEVLLGMGEIQGVLKVLVNDVEIPAGVAGANMTATGWYNLVSIGNRTGDFNLDSLTAPATPWEIPMAVWPIFRWWCPTGSATVSRCRV